MIKIKQIRQLKYPKEFRITPIRLHVETLNDLESLINSLKQEQKSFPEQPIDYKKEKAFYAEISVGVWRLKKKMIDSKNHQPLEEMRKAYRHLESVLLTLEKKGIQIQDHDGQPFDAGLSIKVISFQPTPGFQKETIIETIKPSVYFKGEHILMAEVIVGTPIK